MKLLQAIARKNDSCPPIWMMRQAGRYHSHYQAMKRAHTFEELCKSPELACEVTMGPIRDFDFDAAILFSDLLFPLESLGMGLRYAPGPQFDALLRSSEDLARAIKNATSAEDMVFQGKACSLIRASLPNDKALIGFVGSPWTLFVYAVEGTHSHTPTRALELLNEKGFGLFSEFMSGYLAHNMAIQARSGADCIAIFDTSAGDLTPQQWKSDLVPALENQISLFRRQFPETPIIYYSKGTGADHWKQLERLDIQCLGIDWNHSLPTVLRQHHKTRSIQGNFDPNLLTRPWNEIEGLVHRYFADVRALPPEMIRGWISGLGHGVLQTTPEANVRNFVSTLRSVFSS